MAAPFDICILGRGVVAHALALQLARQRLRVALVAGADQPPPAGHSDVRAYALNAASRALLQELRCWPQPQHATPVLAMDVHGDRGGQVVFRSDALHEEALNWIVDVPALEQLLRDAVRFQTLIEVVNQPAPATLRVVCEGRHSATREALGVEFEEHSYGQTAIAARIECSVAHRQVARQWFAAGDVLAMLPTEGALGRGCALVWSVDHARSASLCAMDPAPFCQALQDAMQSELGELALASERLSWPLFEAVAQRWSGQSEGAAWVLAGDAAHTVHPLAGQGLNLGLGDVAELAKILDTRPYWRSVADPRLLRQYERARKAELAAIGGAGHSLQRLFASPVPSVQGVRNWGMSQFDRSGPLKDWITRRAMGARNRTSAANSPTNSGVTPDHPLPSLPKPL